MTVVAYTATKGLKLLGNELGSWMEGTGTSSVTGTQLVTNGNFDTDLSGWTLVGDGTITFVAGELYVVYGTIETRASQTIPVVEGQTYTLLWTARNDTGAPASMRVSDAFYVSVFVTGTTNAQYQTTFVATSSSVTIGCRTTSAGTAYFDSVSLRLTVPDLSAANKGLMVYGTVDRGPAAAGAELMAYSGFAQTNYLEQAHNTDLDFGTGDFAIYGWLKRTGGTLGNQFVFERGVAIATDINMYIDMTGLLRARILGKTVGTHVTQPGLPVFLAMTRIAGIAYFYVDGNLMSTVADVTPLPSEGVLTFGARVDHEGALFSSELSLWRVASGRTPGEIRAIYDLEKVMFRPRSAYTQVGEFYSIEFDSVSVLTRSPSAPGTARLAIDGTREYLKQRDEILWDVTTGIVDRGSFGRTRRFLESTNGGAEFTFDPHGSLAEPEAPRQATLESNTHAEQTTGSRLLNTTFRVREI